MNVTQQIQDAVRAGMKSNEDPATNLAAWDMAFSGILAGLRAAPPDAKYQMLRDYLGEKLRENGVDIDTKFSITAKWQDDAVFATLNAIKVSAFDMWLVWAGIVTNQPGAEGEGNVPGHAMFGTTA